jgi:NACHT domain- and WD repeat-containing protein
MLTFHVFISSTFSDMQLERDALRARVFPQLVTLCQSHGAVFEPVDLRWGVNREAAEDQGTIEICRQEIDRCRQSTRRPNFVVLLGQRYGWRPPPSAIPAGEFEQIRDVLAASSEGRPLQLLTERYRLDENAVPPAYRLDFRGGSETEGQAWKERELAALLADVVRRLGFSPLKALKYTASATEQEIVHRGLLDRSQEFESVLCFFRQIQGLPDGEQAAEFVDVDEFGRPDADAARLLDELKTCLRQRVPENVRDYAVAWNDPVQMTRYIDQFCVDVHDRLAAAILHEISTATSSDTSRTGSPAHEVLAEDRRRYFVGRERDRREITDYIRSGARHPFLVTGNAGSGKTSLLARTAADIRAAHP